MSRGYTRLRCVAWVTLCTKLRHRYPLVDHWAAAAQSLNDARTLHPAGSASCPPELFRCVGLETRAGADSERRPTLLALRDTAEQACLDAGALLPHLEAAFSFLQQPDRRAAALIAWLRSHCL